MQPIQNPEDGRPAHKHVNSCILRGFLSRPLSLENQLPVEPRNLLHSTSFPCCACIQGSLYSGRWRPCFSHPPVHIISSSWGIVFYIRNIIILGSATKKALLICDLTLGSCSTDFLFLEGACSATKNQCSLNPPTLDTWRPSIRRPRRHCYRLRRT